MSDTRKMSSTKNLVASALLTAFGILIPIVMQPPFKIVLEPASFTLASHVPVMISMFISPMSALIVSIGTALGFLLSGMPVVIAVRALSHIVFALIGAVLISKNFVNIKDHGKLAILGLLLAVIHGVMEVIVTVPFYLSGALSEGFYTNSFAYGIILLVGVGTIVHSCVDFLITIFIVKVLKRARVF